MIDLAFSLFNDKKFRAISDALDNSLLFILDNSNKTLLLPNLDHLNSDVLDHLAWQWHVDFFDINLPIDIKKQLILNSLSLHKLKGTPAAVKKTLDLFFTNPAISEWFNYGGNPYFFKISADSMRDIGDGDISFWNMLFDSKNVRSWLESIDLNLPTDDFPHYHAISEPIAGDNFTFIDSTIPDSNNSLKVAFSLPAAGDEFTFFNDFPDPNNTLNVAFSEPIAGHDFTFFNDNSLFISNNFHATSELIAGDELVKADFSFFDSNSINLFFKFPSFSRHISLNNPVNPPIISDIKKISTITADKKLLFNSNGEPSSGISRAFLVNKSTISVL